MINIGIDVHKKMCAATIKGNGKDIIEQTEFKNSKKDIEAFAAHVKKTHGKNARAVCEATGNYWIILHDTLEECGIDTILAHPSKTKAIAEAKLKDDRVDSEVLADLLLLDMVYESFVPDERYRNLRNLARTRLDRVRTATEQKNKITALLAKYSSGRKFVGLSTIFFSRTYLLRDQATPMTNTSTVLKKALKKEKDARVSLRIVAVNMVAVQGQRVDDVAQSLMMSDDWVRQWVDRYESGGLDALRDRPRAGRPPKVRKDKLNKIIDDASRKRVRPHEVSDAIKRKTGVGYSSRHVLRLMRGRNLSPKKIQYVHVNHASPAAVSKWQKRERRVIAYHRRKGRTVGWGDESHHRRDDKSNALFWTEQGTPVSGTFTNDPQKVSAHGLLLEDTRHMVRLYDRANSDTFIDFLKEAHRRFGPLLIYEDRASYHQSRKVQEFLRDNPEIVLRYTPVGSPYVNPAEHMWLVKSRSSVSYKYHASFEDFCKDLSEHYRTVHYNIDPIKCMNQRPKRYAKF